MPDIEEEEHTTHLDRSRHRSLSGSSLSFNSSVDSLGNEGQVLRHAYVAEITDVVQFCGGQNVFYLSDRTCPIDSMGAGNVVGLMGPSLITCLPKSGLLVSSLRLVGGTKGSRRVLPLAGLAIWHGAPVVSLAIEPATADPNDLERLERGLRLVERSDPCAEVVFTNKGECLLYAAGEIHMQKCLEDLTKYFAPDLELQTSPFVVPFRETVIEDCPPASYTPFDSLGFAKRQLEIELKKKHLVYDETSDNCVRLCLNSEEMENGNSDFHLKGDIDECGKSSESMEYLPLGMVHLPHSKSRTRVIIRVTAHPIPEKLLTWLETCGANYMRFLLRAFKHRTASSRHASACLKKFEDEFAAQLDAVPLEACTNLDWSLLKNRLLCMGPQQIGPNLLFSHLRSALFRMDTAWGKPMPPFSDPTESLVKEIDGVGRTEQLPFLSYGKAILRGFQLATEQGPLCGEPLHGVAFVLEDIYTEDRLQLPTPKILTDLMKETEKSTDLTAEVNVSCGNDKDMVM